LAKPNFQFEKRQRELAKKRKKEEKLQRKLEKTQPQYETGSDPASGGPASGVPGDTPSASDQ